jgi:membrane dipeptidase
MKRLPALSLCLVAGGTLPLLAVKSSDVISAKARTLHFQSIVVDTHDDTTQRMLDPHFDLGMRHNDGNVDIPRLREGGVDAIFFSIWIPGTITGLVAVQKALDQINAVPRQVNEHRRDLVLATTAADIRSAFAEHKIAALIGIEGGHMINSDLGVLRKFAGLGARYMTLTHSVNVTWADSSTDTPTHNGLTEFGKQVVHEMNRLGMMVDISHVADKTFYDVLAISEAPVIASHSSCRALCNAPRNMTDQMMKDLAANGGVIQINYHVGFLSQEFRDAEKEDPQLERDMDAEVKKRCGKAEACQLLEREKVTRELVEQGKLPRVNWTRIIDHIDHAVKMAGADHVGLGSDFDGANMPFGMDDASHVPLITNALLEKGYSETDIQKILGGNTLRVMEQVEAAAKRLGGHL